MQHEAGNIWPSVYLNTMLENVDNRTLSSHFGAKALVIHSRRFSNAAAKFWSALIDELTVEHKDCRRVVLEAVNEGNLDPSLLFPEHELERELNRCDLSLAGINDALQQALADYELYGPPGAVTLRIYSDRGEQDRRLTLPMDCVDAEIFLYLLAWLLEWSEQPEQCWNEPEIKSSFSAADPVRGFKYTFNFEIKHKHLSEGLFAWRLDLKFGRSRSGILPPASLEARSARR